jgi:hypothetical protein
LRTLSVFPAWKQRAEITGSESDPELDRWRPHLDLELGVGNVVAAVGADLVEGIRGLTAAPPSLHALTIKESLLFLVAAATMIDLQQMDPSNSLQLPNEWMDRDEEGGWRAPAPVAGWEVGGVVGHGLVGQLLSSSKQTN